MIKQTTKQLYLERVNTVVTYIREHLDEVLEVKKLAELSYLSPFHFHRIMRAFLGEPIGSFISKTRLETATKLLRYTSLNVEEIAHNTGFEVAASFNKAFKKLYAISPTQYRKDPSLIRNQFIVEKQKYILKAPKIKNLEAKQVLYMSLLGSYASLDYGGAAQKLWSVVKQQKLFTKGMEHLGISHDDPKVTALDNCRYDACLVIHKPALPTGEIGIKTVEGGLYAVFLHTGSYLQLGTVYNHIFNAWLLENEYELRNVPVFEKYISNPERTPEEKLKTEIYLPIKEISKQ